MSLPIKKNIDWIETGDAVDKNTLNAPSLSLETNVDRILAYLYSNSSGDFDYDLGRSSGLTFAYRGGRVRTNGTVNMVDQGAITITANSTAYVEYDPVSNSVKHNTTKFSLNGVPLWRVSTNANSIISAVDMRAMFSTFRAEEIFFKATNSLSSGNVQDAINELDEKKVSLTRKITAGDGIAGGGTLDEDVTIKLGTPQTVTGKSDNVANESGHTHKLELSFDDITQALDYVPTTQADVTALIIALG